MIRFIVGYPAGSTHDLWARLVGPHMTKYILGNPITIVQNMPGAGSATAAITPARGCHAERRQLRPVAGNDFTQYI